MTWKEMQTLPEGQLSSEFPAAPGAFLREGQSTSAWTFPLQPFLVCSTPAILDPQKAEL